MNRTCFHSRRRRAPNRLARLAPFPVPEYPESASTTPSATMPRRRAAASDRSAIRPDTNGPRSFIYDLHTALVLEVGDAHACGRTAAFGAPW
jgi:hypothetical protein